MERRIVSIFVSFLMIFAVTAAPAALDSAGGFFSAEAVYADDATSWYTSANIAGKNVNYVTITDVGTGGTVPKMMTAGDTLTKAESIKNLAERAGAYAAINGTYFSAYDGFPIPWGVIMKDGKWLHYGGGATGGFTKDGKLVIDRLKMEGAGYINGEYRIIPWAINNPAMTDDGAINLYTYEYTDTITPAEGATAVLIDSNNKVTGFTSAPFTVPAGGNAVVYNRVVVYLVAPKGSTDYYDAASHPAEERFKIGDTVTFETRILEAPFTNKEVWENDVVTAWSAGPSLVINGQVTADGPAEDFTEAKINTQAAGRSFIGATKYGGIVIGNIGSATLKEAAEVCLSLGLENAMCMDGGGSVALYYNGVKTEGRAVNNALVFVKAAGNTPASGSGANGQNAAAGNSGAVQAGSPKISVKVEGKAVEWTDAEPFIDENSRTMVPLRAVADAMGLEVEWDKETRSAHFTREHLAEGKDGYINANEHIAFPVGSKIASWSRDDDENRAEGGEIEMDTEAVIVSDRTYAPIRYLAEFFDYKVSWDQPLKTVVIVTDK